MTAFQALPSPTKQLDSLVHKLASVLQDASSRRKRLVLANPPSPAPCDRRLYSKSHNFAPRSEKRRDLRPSVRFLKISVFVWLSMLRPGRPHGGYAPTHTEAYASTDDRRGQKEVRPQQPKRAPDVLRTRPHPGYHHIDHGHLRKV